MMPLRAILVCWILSVLFASQLQAADSIAIVQTNSVWKYLTGTNTPVDWNQPNYNDSAWLEGRAQLGYGDGDENTLIEQGPFNGQPYITAYFRHTFALTNPPVFNQIMMGLLRDDGGVVYLNGQAIFTNNMPEGPITNATLAATNVFGLSERTFYTLVLPGNALLPDQNVLAVEIHQYGENGEFSDDLSFDFFLYLTNVAPQLVRGPYLQSGSSTSVVVHWRTSIPTESIVWYGSSPGNLNLIVTDSTVTNNHIVTISGLTPDTTYYYGVGWPATVDWPEATNTAPNFYFTTAPVTNRPIRIWAIGDAGTANANQAAVRDAFNNYSTNAVDVWLMLGDNAYESGTDAEYQRAVFQMYTNHLPNTFLYPTLGNHETYPPNNPDDFDYLHIFSLPKDGEAGGLPSMTERYYSFDYGNIHFVCLDSMTQDRSSGAAMAAWLKEDLMASTNEWLVAYWHHPPYSKGSHDSDRAFEFELVAMRENIVPILEEHGVDLILCGHSHSYERSYLLHGHYGFSSTLTPSMVLDSSSGQDPFPYVKTNSQGAVYVVAGSSGRLGGGPLNHPAMFVSFNELGSVVIDVDGPEATVKFLRESGTIDDEFTIRKQAPDTGGTNDAPQLVRGPYLQSGSTTGVVVRWRTSVSTTNVYVRYGTNTNSLILTNFSAEVTNEHIITLSGLQPDTQYFYLIGFDGTEISSSDYYFRTAPLTNRPIRIWAIGDAGTVNLLSQGTNQEAVRDAFYNYATNADVWLMLGDNAYPSGTDDQYQRAVFEMYAELLPNTFLYPAIGNHETYGPNNVSDYLDIFSLPKNAEAGGTPSGDERYYSFNYGNIHFVCLDSMTVNRSSSAAMAMWLEADLADNTNEWLIAYWHHPPYSKGSHNSDSEIELVQMRENILPILEEYGVDLVLCGHSHAYERSFLLHGHYGVSSTLDTNTMVLDHGSGRNDDRYIKTDSRGAVYVVAGSSGQVSGGPLNHPAMYVSLNRLGSVVIDVHTNQLDLKFLRENGSVEDYFTLRHEEPPPPPPVILMRGPYLQSGSTTSVVVRWRTTLPTDSLVRYGSSTNMSAQAFGTGTNTDHEVLITGLMPDTLYLYSVGSTNEQTRSLNYFFRTAPIVPRGFRVWAIGDAGTGSPNQQAVRDAYYSFAFDENRFADLWLMLGDNAYNSGTDEEYQPGVFAMYADILPNTFLYPAIGERETAIHPTEFDYLKIFTLPTNGVAGGVPSGTERYYSFDYANAHFICLDSTSDRSSNGPMANWLRHDLATNASLWTIAYWHHPPYSRGSHDSDFELPLVEMRQNIVPILEAYGVDLVLSAHSWSYERSHLISGHYGDSSTWDPATMAVDLRGGDMPPYAKIDTRGAVYVVAGTSALLGFDVRDHDAMYYSLRALGSFVIDISDDRLDAMFLRDTAEIGDRFSIVKPLTITSIAVASNQVTLTWNSVPGATYNILEATEIPPTGMPMWTLVGGRTGAGRVTSWTGPGTNVSSRFYKVIRP